MLHPDTSAVSEDRTNPEGLPAFNGTETGILDIALQTGFHSLSSFNRYFHKIVGSNPQAFRNDRRVIVQKRIPGMLPITQNKKNPPPFPPCCYSEAVTDSFLQSEILSVFLSFPAPIV